ncbi:MAG: DUF2185 domain-containing protein [Dysgonamonadaceae bacterium]|jgi:hypothetical protein|nr:DUF2185 domain-containing protein [Dysgonamonadaceae bacterium]
MEEIHNPSQEAGDTDPDGRSWEQSEVKKYAFVTRRALETDHIGYCYRDNPENNIDSGWRFLYGDEDDEYLDNPIYTETVYPEEMLSINPALDLIFSAPIGSEFEWDDKAQMYNEITTNYER